MDDLLFLLFLIITNLVFASIESLFLTIVKRLELNIFYLFNANLAILLILYGLLMMFDIYQGESETNDLLYAAGLLIASSVPLLISRRYIKSGAVIGGAILIAFLNIVTVFVIGFFMLSSL